MSLVSAKEKRTNVWHTSASVLHQHDIREWYTHRLRCGGQSHSHSILQLIDKLSRARIVSAAIKPQGERREYRSSGKRRPSSTEFCSIMVGFKCEPILILAIEKMEMDYGEPGKPLILRKGRCKFFFAATNHRYGHTLYLVKTNKAVIREGPSSAPYMASASGRRPKSPLSSNAVVSTTSCPPWRSSRPRFFKKIRQSSLACLTYVALTAASRVALTCT